MKELQREAESLVEDHKNSLVQSLNDLHDFELKEREIASLGNTIKKAQERLDEIRKEYPQVGQIEADLNTKDQE